MNDAESRWELLLRYLDGQLRPDQAKQVAELLRSDAAARAILQEIAEQSVMVAELERTQLCQQEEMGARQGLSDIPRFRARRTPKLLVLLGRWRWGIAFAGLAALVAGLLFQFQPPAAPEVARVAGLSGSMQWFGSKGGGVRELKTGDPLTTGNTVESQCGDAWLVMELRDGSAITITGRSSFRLVEATAQQTGLHLREGSLLARVTNPSGQSLLIIDTPTAKLEVMNAQFDVGARSSGTVLRVNEGSVRAVRLVDGTGAQVPSGHQIAISLNRKEELAVVRQPDPVLEWSCQLLQNPEGVFGRWLMPREDGLARLKSVPILLNARGPNPTTLYAAGIPVSSRGAPPVLLEPGSTIRILGHTERPQPVHFGISTKRLRGVFSGKFEIELRPNWLEPLTENWQVELPISDFLPKHPQLARSPEGLELTDIYLYTVNEDIGLEVNRIEVLPPPAGDEFVPGAGQSPEPGQRRP